MREVFAQSRFNSQELMSLMQDLEWWKRAVIYEIYPRSFQDSNGDGIGDLRGILDRLDYLVRLGVDAIWISPIYPSPMADFGYDIADYCGIDPIFGTMADFDRLLAEVHRRGLRLILDFVPNHTSDQHPWFLESRSSRENPKRDWYIWRDQPNNWTSNFGGSGMGVRRSNGPVLLPLVSETAAGSQLEKSRGGGRRCSMSCASGCRKAWTAFAST